MPRRKAKKSYGSHKIGTSRTRRAEVRASESVAPARSNMASVAAVMILISLIVFALGFLVGERMAPARVVKQIEYQTINVTRTVTTEVPTSQTEISMRIPAVDRAGNGVLGNLSIITRQGEGLILVSINDVLADYDTQLSARTAAHVAADLSKTKIDNMDIIYMISAESPLVSGTSAGAAMAVATAAALEGRHLKGNVIITGTVNPDGSIGQVGGILAKAEAAKEHGLTDFLVPLGQSSGTSYQEQRNCYNRLGVRYCTVEYVPESVQVSEKVGIRVVEVSSVEDAARYFFT
jgi:uncharacterized protein